VSIIIGLARGVRLIGHIDFDFCWFGEALKGLCFVMVLLAAVSWPNKLIVLLLRATLNY